ncbi:hypothetical protein JMJ55_14095 [Belnapia sp. T6]|uniref:Uncharacterized protein n=1 Tax=Belnapia mucosa TaxID=2804532 RepID=A0ABS1V463_9PROT|nr:hypothetical protein [Belnapia mucosa]MBL6456461.1 hypothetical protein [Belnapia mucosa]
MRWALPLIAAVFAAVLAGSSVQGGVLLHSAALHPAAALPFPGCALPRSVIEAIGQAVTPAHATPQALWPGLLLGTPDSPIVTAWRGFVDYTKGRLPGCAG